MVAEKLNIPYIWIGAVCILQGDEDDRAREAAKMSGTYLASVLTIAVAPSASVDEGCLNAQSQPMINSAEIHEDWVTLEATLEDSLHSCLYLSKKGQIGNDLG